MRPMLTKRTVHRDKERKGGKKQESLAAHEANVEEENSVSEKIF